MTGNVDREPVVKSATETSDSSRRRVLKAGAVIGCGVLLGRNKVSEASMQTTVMKPNPRGYKTESVRFQSNGVELVGTLFLPLGDVSNLPTITILGPFGFVKEQAPAQYASRLAEDGFAVLIFDPRFSGESGGTPRRYESTAAKIADARASLDYLITRPEVDGERLGALGICQGSSEMIAVVAQDRRVKTLVTVSGQYIYPENIDSFFGGGGMTREARIERGKKAKSKFEATWEVEYTAVVSLTDKNVGLPWKPIHDWYYPWTTEKWGQKSRWENRYATMSDAEVWAFNVDDYAPKVSVPTLTIHGEMSDGGPSAAQHVFELIKAKKKNIHIVPGVFHTRFYDDPLVIAPVATEVGEWFQTYLGSDTKSKPK